MPTVKHLHESFIIPDGGKSTRLDHFLSLQLPNKSRNVIQKHIKDVLVLVNGKKSKSSYQLKPSDKIEWFEYFRKRVELEPYDFPLDIIYEEKDFIVVNKPAQMPMHPGLGHYDHTLQNALLHHYQISNQKDSLVKDCLVQRLDKDTSGIVVIPKTIEAREFLSEQFKSLKPYRIYQAIVWGQLKQKEGVIQEFIGRNPSNERSIEVSKDKSFGKEAITHYRVIKEHKKFSLVECRLETGRTHQIRVHMQFIGHPLVGDKRYEVPMLTYDNALQNKVGRHLLHAKTLHFTSPSNKELLKFENDLPEEMLDLIK
ncbi:MULTISPECIES: RluA family pseudouridine synthase [Flammeovirga]|uniref:Pseudouridine synthase n=1 Tax=Flammeovirga agarivorans TaxID=2726742 RepID=A0A7X8SIZ1_9BACT|nr:MULTISPECIES: RluA family pseudouridine synthase [Flammeovirga]NLR91086.1 RluA family pseudouridine synthase [Flammeovirga agarivorans]